MKKALCFLLSLIMCFTMLPISALATEEDYEAQLIEAGFTSKYIPALKALHQKYPSWEFKALQTNISLDDAVSHERSSHKQQLIQITNNNTSKGYYCKCSNCLVNGKYVIREGSNWVSAAESAVRFYMNPVNFLDEKYIYQFESISYSDENTINGVEAILKGTFMYNSYIEYYDAAKKATVTYSPKTKYSQAIMDASNYSGLSAYYLACKIVQEVGLAKPEAIGVSGKNASYPGIYNYYSIGAETGGLDGLKWASLATNGNTVTNTDCNVRAAATTDSNRVVRLPAGTKVTIDGEELGQGNYVWYKISATYNGQAYKGYIRSDLINCGTDKYNRPWKNPYLSIYNGAKWIADNFTESQRTGYFQKFNVNPESSNLFSHEYMANVQAAASEASLKYNAYKSSGLISEKKTFIIPIFSNIMFDDLKGYEGYSDYIEYTSVKNSFINGTNPPYYTVFSPTSPITRAMFVTILYRMAGAPYDESNPYDASPFTDITSTGVYYYNAACWALDNGITTQTTFKPNDLVVREQTASFLYRYALMENYADSSCSDVDLSKYPDEKAISPWAVEAMKWANMTGMITGTQQGYLNPKGTTQRIHATKILFGFGTVCKLGNM